MFDFFEKQKRFAKIILALMILPFAFFGMESYVTGGGREPAIAEVGGEEITQFEFDRRMREQQDRLRQALGDQARPELFEGPEFRNAVVEGLVQERLLLQAAERAGLRVTDAQLQQVIAGQPEFQEDGQFSLARYQTLLRSAGMSEGMYQERIRSELALSQVQTVFSAGTIVPGSVVDRLLRILEQQREVSVLTIAPETFLKQVELEADAVQKFYEANRREFEIPEQVRVEFVTLSQADLAATMKPTAEEIRAFYEQGATQFRAAEERQASHILIAVAPGADDKARAQARARAEQITAQVRKSPETFAEVARKSSEDPGSANLGGDLGFFARGAMIKGFDEAVFAMKPGDIAGPVETEAGFHVVRLDAVRGGGGASFEQLRPKVEAELRLTMASRRFAELADGFTNTVFEQSDSLKPAAELLQQPIQTSGWFSRQSGDLPKGANERLVRAVFEEDVLRDKRNTAAIEVSRGVLMAARVIEIQPTGLRPLSEVAEGLERRLRLERASAMAVEAGKARLAELRQGKDAGGWSAPQVVSRQKAGALSEGAVRQAFRADTAKLPTFTGVEQAGGGFTLIRISRVIESRGVDPKTREGFSQQASQLLSQEQVAAYIGALRAAGKVEIRPQVLEQQ